MFLFGILIGSGALVWAIAQAILESLPPEPTPPIDRITPLWALPDNMVDAQRRKNQELIAANMAAMTQTLSAPAAPPAAPPFAPPAAPPFAPPAAPPFAPPAAHDFSQEEISAIDSWIRIGFSKNECSRSLGLSKSGEPNSRYARFSKLFDDRKQAIEGEVLNAIEQVLGGQNAINQ